MAFFLLAARPLRWCGLLLPSSHLSSCRMQVRRTQTTLHPPPRIHQRSDNRVVLVLLLYTGKGDDCNTISAIGTITHSYAAGVPMSSGSCYCVQTNIIECERPGSSGITKLNVDGSLFLPCPTSLASFPSSTSGHSLVLSILWE